MSTLAQDNIVIKYQEPVPFPIDITGSNDINAGDLVYWDSSAKQVKSLDSDAHAATLAGVAMDSSFIQPYSTKQYEAGQIPVLVKGIARFTSTSGDTYHEGDALYYGADAQTVTNQAASHIIGYAKMPPGVSSIAGGSTVTIEVQIAPQSPAAQI